MAFTATQYLLKASITATTAATVGSYTVPASTRGMILGLTLANSATSNAMNYADIGLITGHNLLRRQENAGSSRWVCRSGWC
jgi:hypothetical protein